MSLNYHLPWVSLGAWRAGYHRPDLRTKIRLLSLNGANPGRVIASAYCAIGSVRFSYLILEPTREVVESITAPSPQSLFSQKRLVPLPAKNCGNVEKNTLRSLGNQTGVGKGCRFGKLAFPSTTAYYHTVNGGQYKIAHTM